MTRRLWYAGLLAILFSLGAGSSPPPVGACEQVDPVQIASQVKARHEGELFAVPGVVGVGIGRAADTGEVVIRVYVSQLTEQVRQAIPDQLEGIRVEIAETGEFTPR